MYTGTVRRVGTVLAGVSIWLSSTVVPVMANDTPSVPAPPSVPHHSTPTASPSPSPTHSPGEGSAPAPGPTPTPEQTPVPEPEPTRPPGDIVTPQPVAGALTMTVLTPRVTLAEKTTTSMYREFVGDLKIRVRDTRLAPSPNPTRWTVSGVLTRLALVDSANTGSIPAAWAGWAPRLSSTFAGSQRGPVVAPGYPTATEGSGLDQTRVLMTSTTSPGVANLEATITLRSSKKIAQGSYRGTMTISLFE